MAQIEIRENELRFETKREVADMLGAKFVKNRTYKLPKTIEAAADLARVSKDPATIRLVEKMKAQRQKMLSVKTNTDYKMPGYESLRPYQRVDLAFLAQLPHAAIFNQQRTGKSPTLLSLFKLKEFNKMAIIVPSGLKLNWEKEGTVWLPGTKIIVIKGGPKQREKLYQSASKHKKFLVIMSYDTLKQTGEIDKFLKSIPILDGLAIDEAHNIRNRRSQRTKALFTLGKYAHHRYVLTGTPSVKAGHDVWSLLHFLYPDKFRSYWDFLDRYFVMKKIPFSSVPQPSGQYKRKPELENLLALIGTNRKRKDVMQWLPDKQYITIPIELTPKQRKAYQDIEDTFEFLEDDGEVKVDAPSVLAQMTRLRQVCLAPSILDIKAPSAKEEFLMEWLQDNNEPVIIFSMFTSYLEDLKDTIEDKLKEKVVRINGRMSVGEKQAAAERFQSGGSRILLANIEAAGTGFTLDKAQTTIFLDKHWNPVQNEQAEDRMVPVSKDRVHKMNVISLVAQKSYDEIIDTLLQHKHNITSVINQGGITALKRLYKQIN